MTADQSPLFPRASTDRLRTVLTARLPADPKWAAWIDGVVEELAGCVVEDPRLTQIRKLCDDSDETGGGLRGWILAARVRAVLGAAPVDVTPPQGIDRATLEQVLRDLADHAHKTGSHNSWAINLNPYADRILALVQPIEAEPQGIDRAALIALLDELSDDDRMFDQDDLYQGLLALVRPVEGYVLTPEEAALAAQWARDVRALSGTSGLAAERALAARLEALS